METPEKVEQAAERLRKNRAEYEEEERAEGQRLGRRWVLEDAEYPEVRDLEKFELPANCECAWDELSSFLCARNPELYDSDLRELLIGQGPHVVSTVWVEAFVESAKKAWAEVRAKM